MEIPDFLINDFEILVLGQFENPVSLEIFIECGVPPSVATLMYNALPTEHHSCLEFKSNRKMDDVG